MENLNAKQIKKALECCAYPQNLDDCICGQFLAKNALALITSQEQRIKGLEQCLEHEHASAMEIFGQWSEKCGRLTEENERLKATKYMAYPDGRLEMIPTIESVRAETAREMKERLKGKFNVCDKAMYSQTTVHDVIDQITKEMLKEKENND